MSAFDPTQTSRRVVRAVGMSDDGYRGYRSLPVKWGSLHASAARSTLGASTIDSSLGLNIFTVLFLSGTFLAAVVAGLGGFAFGIVGAAIWLYILTPLQTATLIMGLGLVVQGYSVWKLRHALSWRRLTPLLIGTTLGVPLGVFMLGHADPGYLRVGTGAVLVLFSLYGLLRPTITPIKRAALEGDLGAGFLNGVVGGATGLAGIVTVIWSQLRGWTKDQQRAVFQPVGVATFAMSAAWLGGQGSISHDIIWLFVAALPVLLAGTWLGLKLYGSLDEAQFRKLVLLLLLASGATLLIR